MLLVGAFFPDYGAWVFVSLYTLGIAIAVLTAKLMRKFWFKADETPFVMELPPYRMPTMKATIRNMWSKAEQYLRKNGRTHSCRLYYNLGIIIFPSITRQKIYRKNTSLRHWREMPADQTEGMSQSQIEKSMLTEYQQSNSILGKNRTVRRTGCTSYGAWLEILCFSYCRFCR